MKRRRNAAPGDTPPDREIRWSGWTQRTEAPEASGAGKVYGTWEDGAARDGDDQWYVVDEATGSDYSGGTYAESNFQVLVEMLEEHHPGGSTPAVWADAYGGHGTYGILVVWDRLDESIQEAINSLSDYPILDEDHHSRLETEKEDEAWESWARQEFEEAVLKNYEIDEWPEQIDSSDLFSTAMDESGAYWEHSAEGPYLHTTLLAEAAVWIIASSPDTRRIFVGIEPNPAPTVNPKRLTVKGRQ